MVPRRLPSGIRTIGHRLQSVDPLLKPVDLLRRPVGDRLERCGAGVAGGHQAALDLLQFDGRRPPGGGPGRPGAARSLRRPLEGIAQLDVALQVAPHGVGHRGVARERIDEPCGQVRGLRQIFQQAGPGERFPQPLDGVTEPGEAGLGVLRRVGDAFGHVLAQCPGEARQELVGQQLAGGEHAVELARRHAHGAGRHLEGVRQPLAELPAQLLGRDLALRHDLLEDQQGAGLLLGAEPHDPAGLGDGEEDLAGRLALERRPAGGCGEPGIGVRRGEEVDAEAVRLLAHELQLAGARGDRAGGEAEASVQALGRQAALDQRLGELGQRRNPARERGGRKAGGEVPEKYVHPRQRPACFPGLAVDAFDAASRLPGLPPRPPGGRAGAAQLPFQPVELADRLVEIGADAESEVEVAVGHVSAYMRSMSEYTREWARVAALAIAIGIGGPVAFAVLMGLALFMVSIL